MQHLEQCSDVEAEVVEVVVALDNSEVQAVRGKE